MGVSPLAEVEAGGTGRILGRTGVCRGLGGAAPAAVPVRGTPAPPVPLGRAPPTPAAPGPGFLLSSELKKLASTPSFSPGPPAPPLR